jgi:hypothetical protein
MSDSFTNQKRRIFTEADSKGRWGGRRDSRLNCYLCGMQFMVGDGFRWVYANGQPVSYGNFFTCDLCDGDDVLERWTHACAAIRESQFMDDEYGWPVDTVAKLQKKIKELECQ